MPNQQINISQEIEELKWPAVEKQRFVKLWPSLMPEVKSYFYNEVFSFGSELVADKINNALESLLQAQQRVKNGDINIWLDILETAYDDPVYDLGRYIIPFLGWLRSVASNFESQDLTKAINNFDLLMLDELTQEETVRMVESSLAFLLNKVNALDQYKRYLDLKAGFNSSWKKNCALALEKNTESLGNSNITLVLSGEEKKVPPTIKNWLIDYNSLEHSDVNIQKRGGYEQINYINHSQNVHALSKDEKDILMIILKFYDWLKFENQEKGYQNDSEQNLPYSNKQKFELFKEATKSLPPAVPVPKGKPERREMDEIDRNGGRQKADKSDNTALGTLTPTLSQRERGENTNNESNFAKATSDLKKTVSGEAADLGTDNNQFRGQGGGGSPQAVVAPVRKMPNLEDAYVPRGNRVNIQDILKNKEREARNKSQGEGFGLKMGEGGEKIPPQSSDGVARRTTVPNNKFQISNGDVTDKTLTPSFAKATEDKPTLYHPPMPEAMADKGREREKNTTDNQTLAQSGVSKQEEIDKKLEELEKRVEKN